MLPSPYWLAENAVQRGLLFQIPTGVLALPQASSNGGYQEKKLETTWTGSRNFPESSFLWFKNALYFEPVWDLIRNQQSHCLHLLHFSTGAANHSMRCHKGHWHPFQVSDNNCIQMFTPPPETTLFLTFYKAGWRSNKAPGSYNAIFLLQALNRELNMLSSGVSDDRNKELEIGKMGPLMPSLSW